jgi:TPR repeat protein
MQLALILQPQPDKGLEAHGLFLKACRLGLANACTNWAAGEWVFELGQSPQCMRAVFGKACNLGDMFACGMAGRILIRDPSFPGDVVRARILLEMACERDPATCNLLAMSVEDGRLGPPDPVRATHLYNRACDGGNTDVCAPGHGK